MKYVVLDTNFIITALRFKIDLQGEISRICDFSHTLAVLSGTLDELEKLINKGKLFEKRLAKLALTVIKQLKFHMIKAEGHVDDSLAALDPASHVVATQDRELKRRLVSKGFKIIEIRQKKHLMLRG